MNYLIMPTINFFLRSNNDKSKTFVLYCRCTFNGTKCEFSTGEKLERHEFDSTNQKCLSSSKAKRVYIEALIDSVRYRAKMFALSSNDYQTAKQIVQYVLIPKPKTVNYIDSIIEKYIEKQKDYARSTTIKNHLVKLKHFKDFQSKTNHRYTVTEFDLKTAEIYHRFIKDQGKTERNTNATRNIIFIKMVLFKEMSNYDYDTFGIINYTGVKDANPKPVFLNSQDREKLLNWEPKSLYLRNVRDLFLFQCYSGLSFSDLALFEIAEKNGIQLIQGKRFKNGNPYVCPLLAEAKSILERHNYKLPLMTNEPYNRGLKEVCAINGIEIRLTSHVGRKTFATMMNDRGVSRESVAVMLGHSSLQTSEQHYIGFSPERIFLELDKIG